METAIVSYVVFGEETLHVPTDGCKTVEGALIRYTRTWSAADPATLAQVTRWSVTSQETGYTVTGYRPLTFRELLHLVLDDVVTLSNSADTDLTVHYLDGVANRALALKTMLDEGDVRYAPHPRTALVGQARLCLWTTSLAQLREATLPPFETPSTDTHYVLLRRALEQIERVNAEMAEDLYRNPAHYTWEIAPDSDYEGDFVCNYVLVRLLTPLETGADEAAQRMDEVLPLRCGCNRYGEYVCFCQESRLNYLLTHLDQ